MVIIDSAITRAALFDLQGTLISHDMLSLLVMREKLRNAEYEEEIVMAPGALELLYRCKSEGMAIALVTAASRQVAMLVTKHFQLEDCVDAIISANDVSRGKPDPECFLLALDTLGVLPEEAVVFEDTISGMQAARTLGIRTISVAPVELSEARELGVDEYIVDFSEVEIKNGDE